MAHPVIMPKFGMTQTEGTILRWLKQAGDYVEKGEAILEVQTDKVDMEVEAPISGALFDIRFAPDAVVAVTTVIAQIALPGEDIAALAQATPSTTTVAPAPDDRALTAHNQRRASPVAQRMANVAGIDLNRVAGTGLAGRITKGDVTSALDGLANSAGRVRATPAARRLARDQGVELNETLGSGPHGRVQAADVRRSVALHPAVATTSGQASLATSVTESSPSLPAPAGEPLRGRRRTIAARLSQSWQNSPHIFLTTSVDWSQIDTVHPQLAAEVERQGGRLTPTVWIAKVVAVALTRHPRLNAWLRPSSPAHDGTTTMQWSHVMQREVNLGIAVAVDDGLLVPVVTNANSLGVAGLAVKIADLANRARTGALLPAEVEGGTFTISNLGMYPVEHFTAIINPPEVAILAIGRASIQPVWNGTTFEPRALVSMTLSADHRAVDGAVAAAFLAEVKQLLEEPARLLLV